MNPDKVPTQEIYAKMATLCSRSEQSSTDIFQKAMAAGLSSEEAEEIITKLKADRFIDDKRYISSYISDKFKFNKWGKVKIRHYLKMKGLPDNLIQEGLDGIDGDKYRQALLKTMKDKAHTLKKKEKYQKMGQIIRFAQNRGFEPELIHRFLNEVIE